MAKGQKRSTREIRKPKQDKSKAPQAPETTFGSQIKQATDAHAQGGKRKN